LPPQNLTGASPRRVRPTGGQGAWSKEAAATLKLPSPRKATAWRTARQQGQKWNSIQRGCECYTWLTYMHAPNGRGKPPFDAKNRPNHCCKQMVYV